MSDQPKRLYRSRKDVKIAGVLGGMAEYFSVDPSWVRIGYVIAWLVTGVFPLTLLYLVTMFVVPRAPVAAKPEPVPESASPAEPEP